MQSLAGVALMLDASLDLISRGEHEQAREILDRALARTRTTVGELRDLSFNLEPVALRDHGFAAAVDALAQSRGREHRIEISLDVALIDDARRTDAGRALPDRARGARGGDPAWASLPLRGRGHLGRARERCTS